MSHSLPLILSGTWSTSTRILPHTDNETFGTLHSLPLAVLHLKRCVGALDTDVTNAV